MKFATLFSGGELFGVGARQAGLEYSFGVELNPKIAGIARVNGFNYKLTGGVAVNQRVIGNGVPPLFAKQLCKHLARIRVFFCS